ncbi:hypothetical protein LCGC14_0973490, partial [marine sediment metagenome]
NTIFNNTANNNGIRLDHSHTNDVVNKWLEEHSKFSNLSELVKNFEPSPYDLHPETIRDKIKKFLDPKEDKIFSGDFYPTTKNIRMIDDEIGNYEYLSRVISDWIGEKSRLKFKNINDLIEHFNPNPNLLGHLGRHGYTANFESIIYRIENAINQTVIITKEDSLQLLNLEILPKTWNSFFNFLKKNSDWKFVDILTGEIFNKKDIINNNYSFHHIDRNKQNDDNDNLVFLLNHNHKIITLAQLYFPKLACFFEKLLINNIIAIKNGEIPQSWKIGWRTLAVRGGIKLPPKKYRMKIKNKTILKYIRNKKDISYWS